MPPCPPSPRLRLLPLALIALTGGCFALSLAAVEDPGAKLDGRRLYLEACASCHGPGGRGLSRDRVGFDVPLPDFTDCDFASREPNADWIAVAHEGGPVRGFDRLMPAFGEVLTVDEIAAAMEHVRTFCTDDDWPRGELNLPRPLVTEKAYPEDEAVLTLTGATENADVYEAEVVYEQRFGARNQFELVVPFAWQEMPRESGGADWASSLGDVAVGVKRAVWHSLERGSIVSLTAEVVLPTGDEERGVGSGLTVFEPFISYGQLLPAEFFLHGQGGLELPLDDNDADQEAFLRFALGRTFTSGRWGRAWSPMVELLGGRELADGAETDWDIAPQMQVTLNTRQHVMLNAGVRTPLNNREDRETQVIVYLLWDWFDGGLFAGW
jgi:mono/diheme cytochrome c family protein